MGAKASDDKIIIVRESRHGNRMLSVDRKLWESEERNNNRGLRNAWKGFRELKEGESIEIKTTVGVITVKNKSKEKKKAQIQEDIINE